jgi:glycosyltransferase involved in cell wall biosynthesis
MSDYILFLPSWYPSKNLPLDGNFIQRHAEVIAKNQHIIVLYVMAADKDEMLMQQVSPNYTEVLITFEKSKFPLVKYVQYYKHYLNGFNKIVEQHGNPRFCHVHVIWFAGLFAWWLRYKKNIPYIVSEHWSVLLSENIKKLSSLKLFAIRKVLNNAQAVTAVSNHLSESIQLLTHAPVSVVSNVVDDIFFNQKKQSKFDKFTFICVSNFAKLKRIPQIIQSFENAVKSGLDANLILIGEEGGDKHICRELAQHSIVAHRISILPEINKNEMASLMSKCHALISFSEYETQGITVLESLAVGNPVITSDILPFNTYIDFSKGMLVHTTKELTVAMKSICENYNLYQPEMLSKWVSERYSSEHIGNQFLTIYQQLD